MPLVFIAVSCLLLCLPCLTGQLNTKAFPVAETPGGAAAARSAAIDARLEMDGDDEEKEVRLGVRQHFEGEGAPEPLPAEAPMPGGGGPVQENTCTDPFLGLLQNNPTAATQEAEAHSEISLQKPQQQPEARDAVAGNTGEEMTQLEQQPLGALDQQQGAAASFLADISASINYTPAVVAEEGRLKPRKRRRTPAAALAASAVPGGSGGPKNRRVRSEMGGYGEESEPKPGSPTPGSLPSSRFSAGIGTGEAVRAELLGDTTKGTGNNRAAGDQETTMVFPCATSTTGVAASGAVPAAEGLEQSDAVAAHLTGGVCVNSQAAAVQMQQLSALLAPDQHEQQQHQQQQKPYCCAQHLEMLQQMDEIQRQLPEVALCRQSMYRRLLAVPEQPATPEQLRELQSARADFEELSQQQLRMEQQLQLLNQQQHHHALQHRAELLQQQGLAQHNVAQQQPQELLQQQGLLQEQDLLQQRVLQQRLLQQRVLQQQLMQQQQFIQQQQLLQQQQLQPQQLLQQQRIPGGDSFSQLGGMVTGGATSQGGVAAHNTEHEQQQQQPYFGQPTF